MPSTNAVATTVTFSTTLPAHLQQGASRLGNENLSSKDLTTPELSVLQALSPEVTQGKPEFIRGAAAGEILNSVTKERTEEVFVANLFQETTYAVFKKRTLGGGDFQGNFKSADDAMLHLLTKNLNAQDYDVVETSTHTVAIIDPITGQMKSPAIIRFKSTGLAIARDWNTAIVVHQPDLDRFAGIWKVSAVMKTNNKGSWFVLKTDFAGFASEELYNELRKQYLQLHPAPAEA